MEHQNNVKQVIDQLKANIHTIEQESKQLKNGERLNKLRKVNDLRQLVTSLEDIDTSLNELLQQQIDKHSATAAH